MFYYKVQKYDDECVSNRCFEWESKLEANQMVVVPDGYGEPTTARVHEKVEEYKALSSDYEIEPIISLIDMNSYNERISSRNKRALVLKKMQEKMSEVKLIESLKKCAEKDDDMRTLFKEYEETLLNTKKDEEGL